MQSHSVISLPKAATAALAATLGVATVVATGCGQVSELKGRKAYKEANTAYQSQDYRKAADGYQAAIDADPPTDPVTLAAATGILLLLASLAAVGLLLLLVLVGWDHPIWLVYGVAAVCIVWIAHADNIQRLVSGQERKFVFGDREPN